MSSEQSSHLPHLVDAPSDHKPMVTQLMQASRRWLYGRHLTAHIDAEEDIMWHRANLEGGREATLHEDSYALRLLQSGEHAVAHGSRQFGQVRLQESLSALSELESSDTVLAARMRAHRYIAKAIWGMGGDLDEAEAHLQSAYAVGVLEQSPDNLRVGEELGSALSFMGRLRARKFGAGVLDSLEASIDSFRLAQAELTEEVKVSMTDGMGGEAEQEVRTKGSRNDIHTNTNYLSFILGVAGYKTESLSVMKKAMRLGVRRWDDPATWLFTAVTAGIYFTPAAQRKIVNKLVR